MGARGKSVTVRSAARKHAVKARGRRGRRPATAPEAREQSAQPTDDREDALDCQRIVDGGGSSSLPRYYDDYS